MVTASGTLQFVLRGILSDIINNFNALILDLQGQGLDSTPLKSAQVQITVIIPSISQTSFDGFETAINNFRAQVSGTSITVQLIFSITG